LFDHKLSELINKNIKNISSFNEKNKINKETNILLKNSLSIDLIDDQDDFEDNSPITKTIEKVKGIKQNKISSNKSKQKLDKFKDIDQNFNITSNNTIINTNIDTWLKDNT